MFFESTTSYKVVIPHVRYFCVIYYLNFFSVGVIKNNLPKQLKTEGFTLPESSRSSITVKKSKQQELEATCHILSTIKKQKYMNVGYCSTLFLVKTLAKT